MSKFGVHYIDYYIPGEELSMKDLIDGIDIKAIPTAFAGDKEEFASFIAEDLQLKSIRVENKLDGAEMIKRLIEKMFNSGVIRPEDIDLLILAQEPRKNQKNNLTQYLHYCCRMHNAEILNVSGNHCANIEAALDLATSVALRRGEINNILIMSYLKVDKLEDRIVGTYAIEGDAAGIMLVNNRGTKAHLSDITAISNSRLHDADRNSDNSLIHTKYYVKCLTEIIQKNALDDDKLQKIIIQNANTMLVSHCIDLVGLNEDKIFSLNFGRYGHFDCLDFLVNLKDIIESPDLEAGGRILSFGTGWAGTYIASLLSINQG